MENATLTRKICLICHAVLPFSFLTTLKLQFSSLLVQKKTNFFFGKTKDIAIEDDKPHLFIIIIIILDAMLLNNNTFRSFFIYS